MIEPDWRAALVELADSVHGVRAVLAGVDAQLVEQLTEQENALRSPTELATEADAAEPFRAIIAALVVTLGSVPSLAGRRALREIRST